MRVDVVIETGAEQADVEKVHLGVGTRAQPVVAEQRDDVTQYRGRDEHDDDTQQQGMRQLHGGDDRGGDETHVS